ncbi:electron transfer flavoprotein beta subunit [Sanguibacter gelidistatuariae]|uniref:Electron transfer flavoprotein small subunit n=1 Tax=Sanguibacter gelidistatuariae TaxID=1814289 RepID=A0A1G6MZI0_9MICO|nr:electron transfer flavoprotein subunit alpha [Sanguibacter gelidistatuariae]SDC60999.1 electron transfer flavoprotein beta subunit [Sanguibacter gelidistatuariae]
MKIVVAYKWAFNPQDATVDSGGTVTWGRAKAGVSEYDPVAVELGRRLADATGAELIGVSVGGADTASPMATKSALSRGFDRVVVVADDALAGASTTQTALVLAQVIAHIGDVDLVLTGDSSVDVGAQMVPAVLAGALGWPSVMNVTTVSVGAGDLRVERAHEGGSQVLAVTGPVVLAAASDAVVPRVPGMKDILAAGKRPVEKVDLAALATGPSASSVAGVSTSRPELKSRGGRVLAGADVDAVVAELVAALRATNVI